MIKSLRKVFFVVFAMVTICLCQFLTIPVAAQTTNQQSTTSYVSNGSFNSNPNTTSLDTSPSGWTASSDGNATKKGIINVDPSKFEKNNYAEDYYFLNVEDKSENPSKAGSDNKVLMINSRTSLEDENAYAYDYFTSDSISLSANSYYRISFWANTMGGKFSAQLKGLEDFDLDTENGATNDVFFSGLTTNTTYVPASTSYSNDWKKYNYYVSTNENSVSVQLVLYLGNVTSTSHTDSTGIVFFDEVQKTQFSKSEYTTSLSQSSERTKNIVLKKYTVDTSELNFDFSENNKGWTMIGTAPQDYVPGVYATSLIEQGSDFMSNNNKALLLKADENNPAYVGFKSGNFNIKANELYRISVMAKAINLNGSAYIKLVENDTVKTNYGKDIETKTSEITVSSTSTSQFTNDYTMYSFYVQGYELYDTTAHLELTLGTTDQKSYGSIAFDDIEIIKLSYDSFDNLSSSLTNANKVVFSAFTATPTITNGTFNAVHPNSVKNINPLVPDSWTQTQNTNSLNTFGVMNTQNWDSNVVPVNPGNPTQLTLASGTTLPLSQTDPNNILFVFNTVGGKQVISSPNFTISTNSYSLFSFNYYLKSKALTLKLIDNNNNVVFETNNIPATTEWGYFTVTIASEFDALTLHAELVFDSANQSYAFFDNFQFDTLSSMTRTTFESLSTAKLDLSNAGLEIIGDEIVNNSNIFEAKLYTGQLVKGTQDEGDPIAYAGIINQIDHNGTAKNMLAVKTTGNCEYSITSNTLFSLVSGTYYKFSVYAKTSSANDDITTYFKLTGLDDAIIETISCGTFEQFIIYVNCTESITTQTCFGVENSTTTNHTAYFEGFDFQEITSDIFNLATASSNITLVNNIDTTDNEEEDTDDNTPSNTSSASLWIAISTIVMVVAVFVAIIGAIIRKVKVKKIKQARQVEYQRKATFVHDASAIEAERRRDAEIKQLEKEKAQLAVYLKELEEDNKKRLAEQRKTIGKKVTRKAEKEFKIYANNRQKIVRDMERLDQRIKDANTPEYLERIIKIVQHEKVDEMEQKERIAEAQTTTESKTEVKTEEKNNEVQEEKQTEVVPEQTENKGNKE